MNLAPVPTINKPYDNDVAATVTDVVFYDSCPPKIKASSQPYAIQVTQKASPIIADSSDYVYLQVEGTHDRLQPEDIAGCYPADGSNTALEEFLPHIALRSRTLPWERDPRLGQNHNTPWVALLLLEEEELIADPGVESRPGTKIVAPDSKKMIWSLKLSQSQDPPKAERSLQGLDPNTYAHVEPMYASAMSGGDRKLDFIRAKKQRLIDILPYVEELDKLCHLQKLVLERGATAAEAIDPMWEHDPDCLLSVVIGNRLPEHGKKYYACLVSVENRSDLIGSLATGQPTAGPDEYSFLVLLHHWTFKAAQDGRDFQQLMRNLHNHPNGGVLSFGQTPCRAGDSKPPWLAHENDGSLDLNADLGPERGKTIYHGPLCPNPPEPRQGQRFQTRPQLKEAAPGTEPDDSYDAAFVMGRMLALSDQGLLQDLQQVSVTLPKAGGSPLERPSFFKAAFFDSANDSTKSQSEFFRQAWATNTPSGFNIWQAAKLQLPDLVVNSSVIDIAQEAAAIAGKMKGAGPPLRPVSARTVTTEKAPVGGTSVTNGAASGVAPSPSQASEKTMPPIPLIDIGASAETIDQTTGGLATIRRA